MTIYICRPPYAYSPHISLEEEHDCTLCAVNVKVPFCYNHAYRGKDTIFFKCGPNCTRTMQTLIDGNTLHVHFTENKNGNHRFFGEKDYKF